MPTPFAPSAAPDFPFYNGQPVALTGRAWALVLLAVSLGLASLYLPLPAGHWRLVPALLFPLIPLLALRAVAGPLALPALFRRLSARDVLLAAGIAMLNVFVTFVVGAAVAHWWGTSANPAINALGQQGAADTVLFFAASVPQLLGEELLTMLPLLALMAWFTGRLGLSRHRALVWAWLLSALPFALAHLPTYQWNLLQCLLVIGSARLVLSLAYLRSRNLWVSALAHVLNDWMLFGIALTLGALTARPA
ncbi:type II CAAX prenyl endopeptidase Rce1 family protein [Roseateles sp. DC23W]|uniref:Type II CAAX prenyl endopeptidase Rce1 family protein n=1 Tax=Pelomonas dachongensis TaxID=3299029 RepID=A0ABW7EVZ9_9BURK